ncbi:hypothetical protein BJX96DRAFT_144022 [Aspergillus floccosus]
MDFSGNRFRPTTGAAAFPDLMNDPAYDTNTKGKERDFEEPDTCRICRGEGTPEEQLFYPCKCSGSIKFVHQACLVEWLSHSQKKHCELCKTPFHFTKLYDPNMPRSLPTPLFLKQLLIHGFRSLVTWLRFILVAFVWLGWLPWSMRAIWRALFWLADGRWSGSDSSAQSSLPDSVANIAVNSTLSAVRSAVTATGTAAADFTQSSEADVESLASPASIFGFSSAEPLLLSIVKKALSILFFPAMSSTAGSPGVGSANITITGSYNRRRPSWLSDVKFLNTLTSSPTINNILIDTLEGQLITLLVVISFILIFLIREWVVQQQPMANIAEAEREAAVQLIANNRANQNDHDHQHGPQEALGPEDRLRDNESHAHGDAGHDEPAEIDGIGRAFSPHEENSAELFRRGIEPSSESDDEPALPRVHREWSGVETFRDLWARGDGDPERILRIIRDEGLQDELSWVVTAITNLQRSQNVRNGPTGEQPYSGPFNSGFNETPDEEPDARAPSPEPSPPTSPTDDLENPLDDPRFLASRPRHVNEMLTSHPRNDFTFDFTASRDDDVDEHDVRDDSSSSSTNDLQDVQDPNRLVSSRNSHSNDQEQSTITAPPNQADQPAAPPKNLAAKILDWFWADIMPEGDQTQDNAEQDDEHLVEDPALEAPFVPVQNNRRIADAVVQDDRGIADPGLDPNDLDAIEDGDDLEGIMEIIGMQGPIFTLLQNGVFSALLISFTIAIGIWLPYLWGKIALVLLANPVQLIFGVPLTALSVVADVTLDTLIGSLGYVIYWGSLAFKLLLSPFGALVPIADWMPSSQTITSASLSLIDQSGQRLKSVVGTFFLFQESDVPMFSVLSHHALKIHEARIASVFQSTFSIGRFVLYDFPLRLIDGGISEALALVYSSVDLSGIFAQGRDLLSDITSLLLYRTSPKWFSPSFAAAGMTVDSDLAVWDSKDRAIAIIMGYLLASVLGLLYLRVTGLISGITHGQRVDGMVAEVLHQAGGVMKVILIIGIEMIVFPLYCGALLDIALLPLFENATISSRVDFTSSSPLTSLFVHWFIGTCYMFHFALFVSMCRKVMRSGVLYFIRDPDDPTFHPVRDVLERNITTQLRKIAFSALVYGALVIICLGGVVWGLYYSFDNVLPIHWSARVPVLEFPADLLFYNFIIPLAIQSIKPSDVLHGLYGWWFRRCARLLRLTDFFFGERKHDEEGYHVRHTWRAILTGAQGDISRPVSSSERNTLADNGQHPDTYFVRDGRYVRAPASDQVRIPKGSRVFLEVTETNERVDGSPDTEQGLHGRSNDMFTKVYIPPHFRSRIAAFILLIWLFAAATGIGTTIIPLVIGRKIMSCYFPNRALNDIYAFSTGACVVGIVVFVAFYCHKRYGVIKERLAPYVQSPRQAYAGTVSALASGLRLLYIGMAFAIVLPSLFALIMELYILVPAHTYLGGAKTHVIHFVQDWTLGVLYVQMAIKFALWRSTSRPAAALNAIFHDGWQRPNVGLATRAVLLPLILAASLAVALPLSLGFVLNSTMFYSAVDIHSMVYRYSYPVTLLFTFFGWLGFLVYRQLEIWRISIRDDVYLIGERLHNFREKRTRDVGLSRRVTTG